MTIDYSTAELIAIVLMLSLPILGVIAWYCFRHLWDREISLWVPCAFAVLTLVAFQVNFKFLRALSELSGAGEEIVEVVESRSIASFESVIYEGANASMRNFLVYKEPEVERGGDGEYVVMEQARDDGGFVKNSYPADETIVYEDAEPGEERVEVVQLSRRIDGELFGVRVTGVDYDGEETRIHVPEGSIDEGRLTDIQEEER